MCYAVAYLTKRKITYARRAGADEAEIADLEAQLAELTATAPPMFHASGFTHPRLLCFHREDGPVLELLKWGLIPHWVKDARQAATIGRQTLNARGESIFEKPAFRMAAQHRCLILIDGFFEYHLLGKRSFPYHIHLRNGEPMALGGIRSIWHDPVEGSAIGTVSIVTTGANPLLQRIHNNPKAEGPRMPFIVPRDMDMEWLRPGSTKERITQLIGPYDVELLTAHPVAPLLGKMAIGNVPQALDPFDYPDAGLP